MGKIILAIIVITFVISFGYGSFTRNKEVLATVGGQEILVSQFGKRYQDQLDALRQRFPGQADALAQQLNLRERVLNQMIDRVLLTRAAEEEGLQIPDEEIRQTVTGQQAFQVNGQFDYGTYQAVVRQNGMSPEIFETRMREDLLVQQYQQQLLMGIVVSPTEVDQKYKLESDAIDLDYLYLDPAKFNEAAKSDPAAEKAYYESHKAEYLQPEQFKVRYVVLGLNKMQDDAEVRQRAAERYYERNVETEFSTPRKVRASHILKRLDANAKPEEAAAKRATLEKLLKEARSGADFAALAKKNSDDTTAKSGGDLGFFRKEDMVPEFADAAFTLKVGQVSDIVRSPFGLHIIKVTGDQPGKKKPFEEVKAQIEAKLKSERAERRLDTEAARLPSRIEKEGLDGIAKEFKVSVAETGWLDGTKTEAGLGQTAELYSKLHGLKANQVGVLKRNPVQGHVFFQVKEYKAALTRPFDEVEPLVRAKVAESQRRAAAIAEAKQVISRLKTGDDFSAYAKSRGLKIEKAQVTAVMPSIPGVGTNREFQRAAFRLTDQAPYGLSIQEDKAHLLRYKKRVTLNVDKSADRKLAITRDLEQDWRNYFLETELKRLRAEQKVKILIPEILTAPSSAGA
jgi:peptidyl-prolyl cis-trans isomerase D